MKRILVKIGSSVLAKEDGEFNIIPAERLVEDVANLKEEKDAEFVIVTSGAVRLGRTVSKHEELKLDCGMLHYNKKLVMEQVLAAIGQPRLMAFYTDRFGRRGITCAQILTTRSDFADRERYLSLRTVSEGLLRLGVVPIFNENDVLSPEELDFSDNDQLAYMVAAMLGVDEIVILSNVDGVYDGSPGDPQSRVIDVIKDPYQYLEKVDPSTGTGKGGMGSKLQTAKLMMSLGISMRIANGLIPSAVSRTVTGDSIGTHFPANTKKLKPLKNWIATAAVSSGKIVVSTFLADILRAKRKTASILFIGIEKISGDFREKDVVEICDDRGTVLGRGLSRFSSDELRRRVSEYKAMSDVDKSSVKTKENMLAVHYDHFVFSQTVGEGNSAPKESGGIRAPHVGAKK